MGGWHHQFNEHEFEQTLRDSEGQRRLPCCNPWGHKESDMTLQENKSNISRAESLCCPPKLSQHCCNIMYKYYWSIIRYTPIQRVFQKTNNIKKKKISCGMTLSIQVFSVCKRLIASFLFKINIFPNTLNLYFNL